MTPSAEGGFRHRQGGAFVHSSIRRGYGSTLIEQSITRELGGCPYRKPKTADRDRESADMSDFCRLIWCALPVAR